MDHRSTLDDDGQSLKRSDAKEIPYMAYLVMASRLTAYH